MATIMVLRARPLPAPTRSWNHRAKCAVGLMTQPQPGQFERGPPRSGIAGAGKPLIAVHGAGIFKVRNSQITSMLRWHLASTRRLDRTRLG
jgi:hypothetical protein